jgi:hypothetical protein
MTPEAGCIGYGCEYCGSSVTAIDALMILGYVMGLPPDVPPGCLPVGYE